MKRTTPWIVATCLCLATIGGALRAANEVNLAPWAAPAPAPAPKTLTVTGAPTDSVAAAGTMVELTISIDTGWTATTSQPSWASLSATSGPAGMGQTLFVTVAQNIGTTPRSATIEVFATDSAALKQTITINQKADVPANKPITALAISKDKDTVDIGGTVSLNVTITPSDATNQTLTWTSSNPAVIANPTSTTASMSATALTAGNTTITVTTTDGSNISKTCDVHVKAANVPVTNVNLDKTHDTLTVGAGNKTLTASIVPSAATNQNVTWESSNTGIVTVSGSGLTGTIAPVAAGTATIKVTTADGGFEKSCIVLVKPAAGTPRTFTVTPTTFSNPASGGSGKDTITVTSNVAWNATVEAGKPWLTIASGTTGTGNGKVILNYTTNPGAARTATVTLKTAANDTTVTVTVNQLAGTANLDVEDTVALQNVPYTGGNFQVKVKSNTLWRISSNAPTWVTFLDLQGNPQTARPGGQDQTVTVRVLPNTAAIGRTGTITVETTQAGNKITKTFRVSQSATDFSFNIAGLTDPVDAAGGSFDMSLSGSNTYAVSARGTDWLKIRDGNSEKDSISYSGTRAFKFLVKGNETGGPRVGSIRVYYGGALVQTRQITQTGNKINVQIISQGTIPVGGGTKDVRISGSAQWQIRIAGDWLTIDKKQAATGGSLNDTLVTFRARMANTSLHPRTATITVLTKLGKDAHTFTLTQDGTFSTQYDKNSFETVTEKGAERTINVTSNQPWLPTVTEVPAAPQANAALLRVDVTGTDTTLTWLTMNYTRESSSTRSNGTVKIVVKPNTTQLSREALIILKTTNGVTLDTITLKQYNVAGRMTPRATAVKVTSLTMSRPNVTINGEKNVQLSVAVKPENATNKNVIWTSSDTTIAKVDTKGLVTIGKKKGKVTITATAADGSGVKASSLVEVLIPQANVAVEGLKIYATEGRLHLSLPASNDVQIYSISGALVRTFTAPAGDTSVALPSGIYLVRIGTKTEKVAVE